METQTPVGPAAPTSSRAGPEMREDPLGPLGSSSSHHRRTPEIVPATSLSAAVEVIVCSGGLLEMFPRAGGGLPSPGTWNGGIVPRAREQGWSFAWCEEGCQ